MQAVETGTDIAAPPWRVWRLLTDFDAYPAWNPFLTRVQGRPEEGARLRVRVEPPGRGSALTLTPRVVAVETGRALCWRGRLLLLPGLLDGEHAFELEWLAEGRATRLRHAARFTGLLAPFVGAGGVLEAARRGSEAMDAALKGVAERASVEGAGRADA
jgi:hypothetical protein